MAFLANGSLTLRVVFFSGMKHGQSFLSILPKPQAYSSDFIAHTLSMFKWVLFFIILLVSIMIMGIAGCFKINIARGFKIILQSIYPCHINICNSM